MVYDTAVISATLGSEVYMLYMYQCGGLTKINYENDSVSYVEFVFCLTLTGEIVSFFRAALHRKVW